ncbi:hypothetical protein RRG08_005724 [Elysia crispata]|uniref:Uncharacterized protein n=1 Tax=Elysia crispata TaxID=231223 RepID=A0AAE1CWI7_9GAST|nr:hypothetical protein RRG08_005724 [Elysia crispata]
MQSPRFQRLERTLVGCPPPLRLYALGLPLWLLVLPVRRTETYRERGGRGNRLSLGRVMVVEVVEVCGATAVVATTSPAASNLCVNSLDSLAPYPLPPFSAHHGTMIMMYTKRPCASIHFGSLP